MNNDMLTVKQAAEILEVNPQLIRIYIDRGLLPGAIKLRGTRWRIPRAVVELFDGADVSGTFSKKERSTDPLCWVEKPNGAPGQWSVVIGHIIVKKFKTAEKAEAFAASISHLADLWAKDA